MSNDTCTIEGCDKPRKGRGWCAMHYRRWSRWGDPHMTMTPHRVDGDITDRFSAKVSPPNSEGCILWNAGMHSDGYGTFIIGRKVHKAHRVSYTLEYGRIPEGLELDHTCHTRDKSCKGGITCKHRRCVNPQHLEPVTPRENYLRGRSTAKANADKTHCKYAHAFTADNIYGASQRRRPCKACTQRRNKNRTS